MTDGDTRRPLRLGLVGIGKIARDRHMPAITESPDVTLVATASPFDGVEGVPRFPDIDAMLRNGPPLNAVSICTPPAGREAIAAAAIAAGKHVMLEKPPATTAAAVQRLAALADLHGVTLFTSWHSRETAAVDAARAWLADRPIDAVSVVWKEDVRVWHPGQDWILEEGGFGVFDPGVNAMSILTTILPGELTLDRARLAIPANRASPIAATLAMRHASAAPVTVELDFLHGGEPCWNICVRSDGSVLTVTHGGAALEIDGAEQDLAPDDGEYSRLYARFSAMITRKASEADLRPLQIAAAAIAAGERVKAPAFSW